MLIESTVARPGVDVGSGANGRCVAPSARPRGLAPLVILAPPRSFTSVISTMVGQHPQLYGLPETKLFAFEDMAAWWQRCMSEGPMANGLLRTVGELYFGGQTKQTVRQASGWLRRRLHKSTGALLEALALRAHPLILVEKSPIMVQKVESMQLVSAMFPEAHFVHLLRHPRGHAESVLRMVEERAKRGPIPPEHWLINICSYPPAPPVPGEEPEDPPSPGSLDPQWGWYAQHRNILDFLSGVPASQVFRVRGEDILNDPDNALKPLAAWLGLRDDAEAIEEMKHPERSPFACFGPPGARAGNDPFFLKSPALRPGRGESKSLDGPLAWRQDGRGFAPAVRRLATELGYT